MPNTKNALIRQRIIDKCLGSPKNYSIKDLMEACNRELEFNGEHPITAMNTIREDLNQISTNYPDAVIESRRVGRNIFYSYKEKNYSIFKIPFNDQELAQLTQTIAILSRFEGMPQFEWLDDFTSRFKSSLNLDSENVPIVGFDENVDLKGRNHFATLFSAISNKLVLRISYQNFKQNIEQNFIVHPYYLKEYNKRWFLLGYSETIEKLLVYAFDRIVSIESVHKVYRDNTEYNFNEYFDEIIGVTRKPESKPEKVRIKISPQLIPYIRTKPLHGTQREKGFDAGGFLQIQIEVIINFELKQLLLSYAEGVEVLEPLWLRKEFQTRIQQCMNNYQ